MSAALFDYHYSARVSTPSLKFQLGVTGIDRFLTRAVVRSAVSDGWGDFLYVARVEERRKWQQACSFFHFVYGIR